MRFNNRNTNYFTFIELFIFNFKCISRAGERGSRITNLATRVGLLDKFEVRQDCNSLFDSQHMLTFKADFLTKFWVATPYRKDCNSVC
ncbi:hypothetical protein M758_2G096200 [Ceratodon purpureus]|nr:hypothetical protein M758_2G096200 [Ceratodon purpureus]